MTESQSIELIAQNAEILQQLQFNGDLHTVTIGLLLCVIYAIGYKDY